MGGDGTIHKAVNGMMQRKDGKTLPISILPNGSGNDTCRAFNLTSIKDGLKYLLKGNSINYDIIKVLLDYESEEELYEAMSKDLSIKLENHLRYQVLNSCLCIAANVSKGANPLKSYIGKHAYTVVAIREMVKKRQEKVDFVIDDGKYKIDNITSQHITVFNGKYGAGDSMLNPLGIVNDGLFELCFYKALIETPQMIRMFGQSKSGGTHFYCK